MLSISTLTNTRTCSLSNYNSQQLTVQEVVHQYTEESPKWRAFQKSLASQNHIERQPLGPRIAPLCLGCLSLKENALAYVADTLDSELRMNGKQATYFFKYHPPIKSTHSAYDRLHRNTLYRHSESSLQGQYQQRLYYGLRL